MKNILIISLFSVVVLSGCWQEQSRPDYFYTEYNQDLAKYRYLPPSIAEEEIALDIIADRLSGGNSMSEDESTPATTEESTSEATTTDEVQEVTGFSKWVLDSRAWLFFIAYVLVAIIAVWYTKTTGKESDTLTKILSALDERLNFKQRVLYRILKKWGEKKCKK